MKILQALFLIPIFKTTLHSPIQIINVALIVLLAINDYLRRTSNNTIRYASFILSNLIIGYFSYKTKTVSTTTNSITNLRDDIEQIFINFKNTNTYKFNLDFDEQVEKFSRKIKTCIFKILREAITNGIKHGNATSFNIHIYKSSNDIIFIIENNYT